MALPVVLIHGYSSEGSTDGLAISNRADVEPMYDRLVTDLEAMAPGLTVIPINLSRWISLDDGISVEDVSYAMDRALRANGNLLGTGFNAIIHSTGALVARNWIRRFTVPGNCPLKRLIHLAGANFGSGWATVGETLLAKFARFVQGSEQGLASLRDLELGSSWAIDLHTHFLRPGHDMFADYGVMEFCLIGSQPAPEYFLVPVSYGKEAGADGVVRVAAGNLNFNYVKIGLDANAKLANGTIGDGSPADATSISWNDATQNNLPNPLYTVLLSSAPGQAPTGPEAAGNLTVRPLIPFAIPYDTCHTDSAKETAIEFGSQNRNQVLPRIEDALGATSATYAGLADTFNQATAATYQLVGQPAHSANFFGKLLFQGIVNAVTSLVNNNPQAQYDKHAQLIFRITDQFGQPVNDFSVYFNSLDGQPPNKLIDELFVDKHKNNATPNTICFYLRVAGWNEADNADLLQVNGVTLEIDATDPLTQRAVYLPVRLDIAPNNLSKWVQAHRTTVVDVVLHRLPSDNSFALS